MSEVATTGITAGGARQPSALTGVNVTDHPGDAWVAQQLREATPFGKAPKHLICDNDTKYGPEFNRVAEACAIDVIHTPYRAPRANASASDLWAAYAASVCITCWCWVTVSSYAC